MDPSPATPAPAGAAFGTAYGSGTATADLVSGNGRDASAAAWLDRLAPRHIAFGEGAARNRGADAPSDGGAERRWCGDAYYTRKEFEGESQNYLVLRPSVSQSP